MDSKEVLSFCIQKGFLIDKDVLNLLSEETDTESAKLIIEKLKEHTQQRILTKNVFYENPEKVREVFSVLPDESKKQLESLKIKLGLSIEIEKEVKSIDSSEKNTEVYDIVENKGEASREEINQEFDRSPVKVVSMVPTIGKKLEVKDFVSYFRNRLSEMRGFLMERPELKNLVSINKLTGNRQGVSLIGLVSDKKVTKNKNIILELEDLTGKIKVLIPQAKEEIYKKGEDITLDSVIGIRGSGNREIFFANDVIFPETMIPERKKSSVDESVAFISDVHVGSHLFLEDSLWKFVDYLNSDDPEARKIKYLFVVGDLVAGVGVYPNQKNDLEIPDIEGQYLKAAEFFEKIRKDIQIVIIPGNHDCVRLAEPQPVLDEKYAWPLHQIDNVTLAANPSTINIGAKDGFGGFDVLMYHGFSFFYYAGNVPKLIEQDSPNAPDKIMHYLLQHRHLAPTHSSSQIIPHEKDPLIIRKIPDLFVSGHTHKSAVSYYNNVLVISSSCWEDLTPFQEKMGSKPDFCKVPLFNLKTRQVKILDFESEEHKEFIKGKNLGGENDS